jgi:hypothetical protein
LYILQYAVGKSKGREGKWSGVVEYVRDEKCVLFFDRIPEWKRPLGRLLHKWKIE